MTRTIHHLPKPLLAHGCTLLLLLVLLGGNALRAQTAVGTLTVTATIEPSCLPAPAALRTAGEGGPSARVFCQGASMELVTENGFAVPPGATVSVENTSMAYEVGTSGQLFARQIALPAVLRVRSSNFTCNAAVPATESRAVVPDLGRIVCKPAENTP